MSVSVLVVEDNPINRKLVRTVLTLEGYEVEEASNASETFALLDGGYRPSLILMDIQLPEVSGVEITMNIRQRPEFQDTIIVALTAYAMKGDRERFLAAGCDEYVAKPFEPTSFLKTLERLLGRSNST